MPRKSARLRRLGVVVGAAVLTAVTLVGGTISVSANTPASVSASATGSSAPACVASSHSIGLRVLLRPASEFVDSRAHRRAVLGQLVAHPDRRGVEHSAGDELKV
jgi:hypothetical protein